MFVDFPLIKEAKIQYVNLAIFEAVLAVLGGGLWLLGWKLWRMAGWARRIGGGFVLVVAIVVIVGWLLVNSLVIGSALGVV